MREFPHLKTLTICMWLVLVPALAHAQASIAGVVNDASGAVLPGVTVEAASPALIERVRTAVTDGAGQYKLVDLVPGGYTVTFTLPGFNTVKREGITLSAGFTATVDAELRVGALEETITVSGASPLVDVQNTREQTAVSRDVIDALPIDNKRQLLIIRRDNVEHLILTGGPQDVVVETGIAVEQAAVAPRPIPVARRPAIAPQQGAPQAPQRAPLPQRAPAPEAAPLVAPQFASNDEPTARNPLDRLRDLGRPTAQRRSPSLRHTGLMRPVSRMEPALIPANADNSDPHQTDSATTSRVTPFGGSRDGNGQAFGGDGNSSGQRDEGY